MMSSLVSLSVGIPTVLNAPPFRIELDCPRVSKIMKETSGTPRRTRGSIPTRHAYRDHWPGRSLDPTRGGSNSGGRMARTRAVPTRAHGRWFLVLLLCGVVPRLLDAAEPS